MQLGSLLLIALTLPSASAAAQATDASWRTVCNEAVRVYATQRAVPNDTGSWRGTPGWAYVTIPGCGVDGAHAVARRLAAAGHESNVDSLLSVIHLAENFRDSTLFEAELTLAADTSNTPESRAMTLIALYRLFRPNGWIAYELLSKPPRPDGTPACRFESFASDAPTHLPGDPLPANASARVGALVIPLRSDTRAPAMVRNAAICFSN
jgi:hypothetical protein